eukprot:TRINITY_DN2288_c0_g1_i4.p1 TRINITY_DN2288_c0_g1~~TRINITY_DN2288_c0_g1_i4.p1  ORF type:complete len:255 (+),score=46.04 TRINITY_DN2288_c0_g1_i4:119-883(+)
MMREITSFSLGVFLLLLWGQVTPYSVPLQNNGLLQSMIGERMGIDFGTSLHKLSKREASIGTNIDDSLREAWFNALGYYLNLTAAQGKMTLGKIKMACVIKFSEDQKVLKKYYDGKLSKDQKVDLMGKNHLDWMVKIIQVVTKELDLDAADLQISPDQFEILQNMKTFEGIQSSCDAGLFQCRYGICINQDLVCDGSNDCLDDEDEQNCTSATTESDDESDNLNDNQHGSDESETENNNGKTDKNTIKHLPTSF